jgi:hypothetical protein
VAKKKAQGPRGGVKHQPGRGHDRKSAIERKRRFAEKQRQKRAAGRDELRKLWEQWDKLTDEQKKLLPELEPPDPRPPDVD